MEYGKILRQAFETTIKHKALWFLGMLIFSGSKIPSFGSDTGKLFNDSSTDYPYPAEFTQAIEWFFDYIIIIGAVVLLLTIVLIILHTIATGGMFLGVNQARLGKKPKFGALFKEGSHYFWQVLGLNLILGLVVAVAVVVISIPLLLLAVTIVGLIIAIPGFIVLFAALMLVGVFQIYALQYLVLRRQSIMNSFQSAWKMLRAGIGHSIVMLLLLGLISLGIFIGVVIVIGLAVAVFVGMLFLAAYDVGGAFIWPVAIIGGLVLMVGALFVKGIMTTFSYNVWHLTFIELEKKLTR